MLELVGCVEPSCILHSRLRKLLRGKRKCGFIGSEWSGREVVSSNEPEMVNKKCFCRDGAGPSYPWSL